MIATLNLKDMKKVSKKSSETIEKIGSNCYLKDSYIAKEPKQYGKREDKFNLSTENKSKNYTQGERQEAWKDLTLSLQQREDNVVSPNHPKEHIMIKKQLQEGPIPLISIKTEFNTGLTENLSDNTSLPEILKHTKAGENIPISTTPHKLESLQLQQALLPPTYFSSYGGVPGAIVPPFNTNPLLLPGLMNIPRMSFSSSLESLARASTDQARHFSQAHLPAATSTAVTSESMIPPSSTSAEVALQRHEHMHTHLHYVTSPTHNN